MSNEFKKMQDYHCELVDAFEGVVIHQKELRDDNYRIVVTEEIFKDVPLPILVPNMTNIVENVVRSIIA